jgi:hypothetical protein
MLPTGYVRSFIPLCASVTARLLWALLWLLAFCTVFCDCWALKHMGSSKQLVLPSAHIAHMPVYSLYTVAGLHRAAPHCSTEFILCVASATWKMPVTRTCREEDIDKPVWDACVFILSTLLQDGDAQVQPAVDFIIKQLSGMPPSQPPSPPAECALVLRHGCLSPPKVN